MTDKITLDEFLLKYPMGKMYHKDTRSTQYLYTLEASATISDVEFIIGNGVDNIMKDAVGACLEKLEGMIKKAREDFERVV